MPFTQHCIFCGLSGLTNPNKNVSITSHTVHAFLKKYVQPSSFHYQALMNIPVNTSCRMCLHCISWKRNTQSGRKKQQPYTPLDHMLHHAMEPGVTQEPDHRCLKRLLIAVSDPNNRFKDIIPFPVHRIIQQATSVSGEEIPEKLVLDWWEANGKTTFFRNNVTSKMVRRANRQAHFYKDMPPSFQRMRWRH